MHPCGCVKNNCVTVPSSKKAFFAFYFFFFLLNPKWGVSPPPPRGGLTRTDSSKCHFLRQALKADYVQTWAIHMGAHTNVYTHVYMPTLCNQSPQLSMAKTQPATQSHNRIIRMQCPIKRVLHHDKLLRTSR